MDNHLRDTFTPSHNEGFLAMIHEKNLYFARNRLNRSGE